MGPSTVRLLDVEPDLGEDLFGSEEHEMARRNSVVRVLGVGQGGWSPQELAATGRGGVGLLILEGACLRREAFGLRRRAEALGEGDLVRTHEPAAHLLPTHVSWHALGGMRLAVLDRRFAARMTPFPAVIDRLIERLERRLRAQAQRQLISVYPGLPAQLLMTIRQLVNSYGRTAADGLVLPWRLPQSDLAEIMGATRQSLNKALKLLRETEILHHRRDLSWWISPGPRPALQSAIRRETEARSTEGSAQTKYLRASRIGSLLATLPVVELRELSAVLDLL